MEFSGRNPFMDLSGFVNNQEIEVENCPAQSLKAYLLKKRCTTMINIRRLRYKAMCEAYQRGRI